MSMESRGSRGSRNEPSSSLTPRGSCAELGPPRPCGSGPPWLCAKSAASRGQAPRERLISTAAAICLIICISKNQFAFGYYVFDSFRTLMPALSRGLFFYLCQYHSFHFLLPPLSPASAFTSSRMHSSASAFTSPRLLSSATTSTSLRMPSSATTSTSPCLLSSAAALFLAEECQEAFHIILVGGDVDVVQLIAVEDTVFVRSDCLEPSRIGRAHPPAGCIDPSGIT